MAKSPMTKRQMAGIIANIKKHKHAIAKHRDELRNILEDLESIVGSADDGLQSLEYAVEQLSSYL